MTADFSVLDRPEVLMFLFHPRREDGAPGPRPHGTGTNIPGVEDILVPVADDVAVGVRFHLGSRGYANLLFFHGNGEIAADYDEIGPILQPGRHQLPGRRLSRLRAFDRAPHGDFHGAGQPRDLPVRHRLAAAKRFRRPL